MNPSTVSGIPMDASQLIADHMFLADVVALDYSNIPSCRLDEARSEAYFALTKAAQAYDPQKGEFVPFASRVIRNALNSLYAKQLKLMKAFPQSLDDPVVWANGMSDHDTSKGPQRMAHEDPHCDVRKEVRSRETAAVIETVMNLLSPRERFVMSSLRAGHSFTEIGSELGISKQAAHKTAGLGIVKLRTGLERLGYRGVASDGHLASRSSRRQSGLG